MSKLLNDKLQLWLVDDDPDDLYLLAKAVKEADPTIELTYFGEGRSLIEELQRGSSMPDLIMLDLNMPRLTGMETLHLIKQDQLLKGVPVVIYSTSDCNDDIREAYEAGASTFFVKPETYSSIRVMVERLFNYWTDRTCRRYPGKEA